MNMRKDRKLALKELQEIPSIGKSISEDLWDLGIRSKNDLKKIKPEALYEKLCKIRGERIDRCVLYTFRCAHYYATEKKHQPRLLKWWNWMDK